MTDQPTPGQVAYAAFMASLALDHTTPWHRQDTAYHAHWEAAAQAVLAPPFPGTWETHAPALLYLLRVWRDQEPTGALRTQLETTIQALHSLTEERQRTRP